MAAGTEAATSAGPILEPVAGEGLPGSEEESLESVVEAAAQAAQAERPATPPPAQAPSLVARMTSIAMVVPAKLLFGFRS